MTSIHFMCLIYDELMQGCEVDDIVNFLSEQCLYWNTRLSSVMTSFN